MKRLARLLIFGLGGLAIVLIAGRAMLTRNAPRITPTNVLVAAAPAIESDAAPTAIPPGYMSHALLGDKWPLTTEYGWIECDGTAIIFRSANGDYYAVNGTAQGQRKAKGWHDIHDIDVPTPNDGAGTIKSLQPLLDVGLKLCR